MRKSRFRLGALLFGAGLLVVVFKGDDVVRESAAPQPVDPLLVHAPTVNWTNSAARFGQAAVIERKESFSRALTSAATEKVVVEVVKTRSKYPYIRVETRFRFDPQARAWVAQRPIEYVADHVLAQLNAGAEITDALTAVHGKVILRHETGDSALVLVGLPEPTVEAVPAAIQKLTKFGGTFASIEPHVIRRGTAIPNDPEYYRQWALQNINAPAAWDIQRGNATVVVAVADSGVDFGHADLAPRIWANPGEIPNNFRDDDGNGYVDDYRGYDFANLDANPADDLNHGTFVSGVIGAAANNNIGMAGVCWNVRIMPVKVMDFMGSIYAIDFIRGLDYARVEGAKIVNASFGGAQPSQSESDAISRLRAAGVLLVTAAGNDGSNNEIYPVYPASYAHDNIISATHSDTFDNLTFDSNFGRDSVDLAAPGEDIFSAAPGNSYRLGSGSSFAAPQVTGVAALLKAQDPGRSYANIKSLILNNVDRRPGLITTTVSGGRLNAFEPLIPRVPLADALDAPYLTWQTGGNRAWFGQNLSSSDGVDAARCGNLGDNQFSWVLTTVTGPGMLWFDWRVSSEEDADLMMFSVDGTVVDYISGESGWLEEVIEIPAGTHTLRWDYDKDVSLSVGEDKGWLDRVLYVRDTTGPAITVTAPLGPYLTVTDILLEGTIYDIFGVDTFECRVSNANGVGPWQPIFDAHVDGPAPWQFQLSNLTPGTNIVRLRAADSLGHISSTNVIYVVLSPLTVNLSGCGSVQSRFAGTTWQEVGKTLTIRATPCAGSLFTHWSGDIPSSNAALSFVMQPNLALQANFAPNPFTSVAGAYNGLFHEAAGVLHESSGLLRITLADSGTFSGTLISDGATNGFSSRFDPVSGASSFSVPRPGRSTLQVSLQLDFVNQITGQIGNGTWTADLVADRRGYAPSNPPPFHGMYTLSFPGAADSSASPAGHGFATATVDTAGRVSVDGRLGDNARILQTIPISSNGDWPFYAPLYTASRGSVLGWFRFLSPPGITNQLASWIKPTLPAGAYYRHGFSNELSAIGSPYVVPQGIRVIDCTNALVILRGSDYGAGATNQMVLNANNSVLSLGPENVTMTIVTTNGTFRGTVIRPGRTNTFRGAFLQQQNIGLGYILGSNYVGEVRFEPATP